MTSDPTPSWDEVLADCEASAAHAEMLLRGRGQLFSPPAATFDQLPTSMPIPTEAQLARARAIHERHQRLQAELAASMREIEHEQELNRNNRRSRRPKALYIDRRL